MIDRYGRGALSQAEMLGIIHRHLHDQEHVSPQDIAGLFTPYGELSEEGRGRLKQVAANLVPAHLHLVEGMVTPLAQMKFWYGLDNTCDNSQYTLDLVTETFTNAGDQRKQRQEQCVYIDPRIVDKLTNESQGGPLHRREYLHKLFASLLQSLRISGSDPVWSIVQELRPHSHHPDIKVDRPSLVHEQIKDGKPVCLLLKPNERTIERATEANTLERDSLSGFGYLALLAMHHERRRPGQVPGHFWPTNRVRALIPGVQKLRTDKEPMHLFLELEHWKNTANASFIPRTEVHLSWIGRSETNAAKTPWNLPTCIVL